MPALVLGRQRSCAALLGSLLAAALVVTVHSRCMAPPRSLSMEPKVKLERMELFPYGYRVEFVCRPGFARNAHTSNALTCGANGEWQGSSDICIPKSCVFPEEPANGRLVLPAELTFGSTVTFTCNPGYRLIGHAEIECMIRNGVLMWNRNIPTCEAIPCVPPPEIENGQHSGMGQEHFVYGDSVTYHCHSPQRGQIPFSLVGEASIFCTTKDNLNGVWSSPAPECKVLTCKQPKVEHGKLLSGVRPQFTFGDTVVFDCDLHYSLSNDGASTCRGNDLWEPPLPLCQRSSCDGPPDVRNAVKARLAGNLFPVGTVVTYECQHGHRFSTGETSRNISCLPDFVWSEPPAPCERISCPHPQIPNEKPVYLWRMKEVYDYGDRLEVTCSEGFAFKGRDSSVTLRCGSDGEWDPAVPECIPEPHCPEPNISHGIIISGSRSIYPVGAQVKLDCVQGYDVRGSASITCGAELSWEPVLPFCDEVCGAPPRIPFGRHSGRHGRKFSYGAKVTYECEEGLSLVGNKTLYCTSDNGKSLEWSGPAPECRVVRCPRPVLERGRMAPQVFTFPYGLLLHFSCAEGFGLRGAAQSRCRADGTWDPPVPTCEPVLCPQPRVPFGRLKSPLGGKRWYQSNESITLECLPGYQLPDNGVRPLEEAWTATCLPDGSWTPLPKCMREGDADVCQEVHYLKSTFECGVPAEEVRNLLEIQKLFLEIKKLEMELEN